MKLIVGLGNPDKKYFKTRHNVGFMVLDKIIKQGNESGFKMQNQFESEILTADNKGQEKIIFAKPQTYMNNSGQAVQKIMNYYKIKANDLWVICDDLNLDLGIVRVRLNGSDGGHNGLKSIIESIKTDNFVRIRFGIGKNIDKNIVAEQYVLQKFDPTEEEKLDFLIDKTAKLVVSYVINGIKEETIKI